MPKKSKKEIVKSLHHLPSIHQTLGRMLSEGRISRVKADYIEGCLEEWVDESKYILFNLGVHLSIGFVRFVAAPFPLLGSISRFLWVLGNRIYYSIKGDALHKKIHSLTVLFFSFIPFLGYFAYVIPLKKKSEYLAYLYAEHVSYMMYGETFESKLKKYPKFVAITAHSLYSLLIPAELKKRGRCS